MAIDTRRKRESMYKLCQTYMENTHLPRASITDSDRYAFMWLYQGIALDEPAAPAVSTDIIRMGAYGILSRAMPIGRSSM